MAVTNPNEIELNGYKYKITSPVRKISMSQFPAKITIGDNTYDNQKYLSSWNISGEKGNGVEEMNEKEDAGKAWFTNCITEYKNHLLPPRLAIKVNAPVEPGTPDIVDPDMELDTGWTGGSRTSLYAQSGTYSRLCDAGSSAVISYQDVAGFTPGNVYTFKCWCFAVPFPYYINGQGRIGIDDGVTTTYSSVWGINEWGQLSVTKTISPAATRLRLVMEGNYNTAATRGNCFDTATLTMESLAEMGKPTHMANFNGDLYVSFGRILAKLATDRTEFEVVADMLVDVTALIPSLDSKLYIYVGDATNYYYMDTSETIAQTDVADAYYGWQYDNKLFKCNSTGTVTYCANPDTASPSWVAAGTITDIADQIERFIVARDAAGSTVSYAATNSILKVLDLDTPEWLDTEVRLPNHPQGGKGACYFNGRIYLSYGLGVLEYNPNTGYVRDIGLTERDGLPIDFNGEIVYLLGDSSEKKIFALVDSSITSGDSYSGLYSWSEDTGWQCWWYDDTVNQAMSESIVSSAESAYAIYWGVGSNVYYIDIPRGVKNPDKISQNYATSGVFITPWFDAANGVALKLAKSLQMFCSGITTTETVALKYRINHTYTDLGTGWTTMDTLNTAGESGYNEELFGSGAGIAFRAIQFRLDFGTSGATAHPDAKSLVLYFKKETGSSNIWAWDINIKIEEDSQYTAKQKYEFLEYAKESDTDILFSYHPNDNLSEQFYVQISSFEGTSETGRDYRGRYSLRLIES
jgi:hypothetical protein